MKKLLFKLKNLFKKHPLTYDEHDILQLIWKDLEDYDSWIFDEKNRLITILEKDGIIPKYSIFVPFKQRQMAYVLELGPNFFTEETANTFSTILLRYLKKKRNNDRIKGEKEILRKAAEIFPEAFKNNKLKA